MGCTRSRLKTLAKCVAIVGLVVSWMAPCDVWAAVASQFSLLVGEQATGFFGKLHPEIPIVVLVAEEISGDEVFGSVVKRG